MCRLGRGWAGGGGRDGEEYWRAGPGDGARSCEGGDVVVRIRLRRCIVRISGIEAGDVKGLTCVAGTEGAGGDRDNVIIGEIWGMGRA